MFEGRLFPAFIIAAIIAMAVGLGLVALVGMFRGK